MAVTVTKAGPYFAGGGGVAPNNQTNMKFSQLRNTFRVNNPSGTITAGELRRDTNVNSTDPIVPDCTENNDIESSSNWKVSQMRDSIKYYYMDQPSGDTNTTWNISTQPWNGNLGKNIKKWLYLRGNNKTSSTASPGAKIVTDAWNLRLEVHGTIYGAGGAGGTSGSVSGTAGGDALQISNGSVTVAVQSSGRIWAGGGGGEYGTNGTGASQGSCRWEYQVQACASTPSCPTGSLINTWGGGCCNKIRYCGGPWNSFCWHECWGYWVLGTCRADQASSTPSNGIGGNGGAGRGWNNFSGSISGASGTNGTCPTCPSPYVYQNDGNCGGNGGMGGNGGDWGENGGNTGQSGSGGSAGDAISGSGYTVTGNNSTTVKGSI